MPGQYQLSLDQLGARGARSCATLGVRAVLLFGLPAAKDELGSEAYADDGIVQQAVRALKDADPDAAASSATSASASTPTTATAASSTRRARSTTTRRWSCWPGIAVSQAEAGADIVAPSDMMDGRVAAIRAALDDAGLRVDADHGLRRQVRLGLLRPVPRGRRLARPSSATGAATRWTRPTPARRCARSRPTSPRAPTSSWSSRRWPTSTCYRTARERFDVPLAAYNVSGEYAMVKAAAASTAGSTSSASRWRSLTGIKRAGADIIITYHAKEAARWLA